MSINNFQELEKLKIIYSEILNGYSIVEKENIFVKHFSEIDHTNILRQKKIYINDYLDKGLESQKDKLQNLIKQGEWSDKQEDDILSLKLIINDNEKNINTVIPEQRNVIKEIINKKKEELSSLLFQKQQLIGGTAEYFSEQDILHYVISMTFFKDINCSKKVFEDLENFEDLSEEEITKYINLSDLINDKFSFDNIKKISVLPFFINSFSYCKDNVYSFLNIPLSKMTTYQFSLISLGGRNLNVLSNAEADPPIVLQDSDINPCINWYDQNYSILIGRKNINKH